MKILYRRYTVALNICRARIENKIKGVVFILVVLNVGSGGSADLQVEGSKRGSTAGNVYVILS